MQPIQIIMALIVIGVIGVIIYLMQPKPCAVGNWSAWSTCNGGTRFRTRKQISGTGVCPKLRETSTCTATTPATCTVSEWGPWACVNKEMVRTRKVLSQPTGSVCPQLIEKGAACVNTDCVVSEWGPWQCAAGVKTRKRTVVQPGTGSVCPTLEERGSCAARDCAVTPWSAWVNKCSELGYNIRTRAVISGAEWGGAACPDLEERNDSTCPPQDCIISDWQPENTCPEFPTFTAKFGEQRQVLAPPRFGGAICPTDMRRVTGCPNSVIGSYGTLINDSSINYPYPIQEVGITFRVVSTTDLQGIVFQRAATAWVPTTREIRVYADGELIHTGVLTNELAAGQATTVTYKLPQVITMQPGVMYHVTYIHTGGGIQTYIRDAEYLARVEGVLTEVYGVIGPVDQPGANPPYQYGVDILAQPRMKLIE